MSADLTTTSGSGTRKNNYRAFRKSNKGLYYTDMRNWVTVLTLATVKENKSNYSDRYCNISRVARKFQDTMGNIGIKYLMYMIGKRLIPNFLINRDDLKAANDIFGTRIKALKVKTVRKPGEHAQLDIERIPYGILDLYKNVTLTTDIMFVNKIRYFIMISRHIQFGTVEVITDAILVH